MCHDVDKSVLGGLTSLAETMLFRFGSCLWPTIIVCVSIHQPVNWSYLMMIIVVPAHLLCLLPTIGMIEQYCNCLAVCLSGCLFVQCDVSLAQQWYILWLCLL